MFYYIKTNVKILFACIAGMMYVIRCYACHAKLQAKTRFPLPELTARVDGPSTRLVETFPLPVLTGNGNRSPVNSAR